jgi:hypothetical protein
VTDIDDSRRIEGEPTEPAVRWPGPEPKPRRSSRRPVATIFVLALLCSLAAVGVGIYGAAQLAISAISTEAARRTGAAAERARAKATELQQTQVASDIGATQAAAAPPIASSASAPGPQPPAGWRQAFSEPFDSDVGRWLLLDEPQGYATQKSTIANGVYHWETEAHQDFVSYVYPASDQASDFHATVRARRVSGTMSGEYGLVFRILGESYYRFVVSDLGLFTVEKYNLGEWTDLISSSLSTEIRPGEINALTVAASGDQFTFYINGTRVGEAQDRSITNGYIGVTIGLQEEGDVAVFEFDEFEVWVP